jgi:hypothetical protein
MLASLRGHEDEGGVSAYWQEWRQIAEVAFLLSLHLPANFNIPIALGLS